MLATEFVQAYPRDLTNDQIHSDMQVPEVRASQRYSYAFGRLLHDVLSGTVETPGIAALPDNPVRFKVAEKALVDLDNGGTWAERGGEIQFHLLNEHMLDMWTPIVEGGWPTAADALSGIRLDMNSLSLAGTSYYGDREKFIRQHGTEKLYASQNERRLARYVGMLGEVDSSIVVLDVMRAALRQYPGLTIVPGPMQFEKYGSSANADHIVLDTINRRAVGVQTKSRVTQEVRDAYDPDRIVLLDGDMDLNNVRAVRTRKGSSRQQIKSWPGIVSASRVAAIKLHGKQNQKDEAWLRQNRQRILQTQLFAREFVRDLRVDWRELAARIGDRILAKL